MDFLEPIDHALQFSPYLAGNVSQFRVVDGLHGCHRVYGRDLDLAFWVLLHNNIAGKHGSDLVLRLQPPLT